MNFTFVIALTLGAQVLSAKPALCGIQGETKKIKLICFIFFIMKTFFHNKYC